MSKTKWYRKPTYLLVALALVLSLGIAALPMAGTVGAASPIYVNGSTGNDSWDGQSAVWDGTHGPKKTIKAGIAAVDSPGTVHVAAGTYPEKNINLEDNVQVLGAGADVTIIDGGGSGPVIRASGVGPGTKLDGFTITNGNTTDGGGIRLCNSSPVISNCIFSGNSAASYGGGMYNYNNSSPTVTNCTFDGNSAGSRGGGIYNRNCSPTVTNCIFSGNSATSYDGGGIYNYQSSPTVTNCLFTGNSAIIHGGGMYNYNSSPTVTNCILWDNGEEIFNYGGSAPVVTYCNIQGGYSGVGNIDADPMFVNPTAHDYHSKPGSPCIDAGTNVGAPSEDIEGNPRPVDGDGDGWAITDMGAYEYVRPTPPPHFRYLHAEGGWMNITNPIGTQWHELWPIFYREYHLSSWNDTGGDGLLSRCDRIDMYQKPDGEVKWYHVENVTITLNVTPGRDGGMTGANGSPPPMYIELEGGYNASVLINPVGTQWHEIYPILCRQYELSSWNDTGSDGLKYCDYIELTDKWTGEETWWHVEEVTIDIIVTIEPPPVGGEAYPVNKFAVLAPWIAAAALLAGGTGWYVLRRRRAQS